MPLQNLDQIPKRKIGSEYAMKGALSRVGQFERKTIDMEKRTVELSFSSEFPVRRFFGNEILDHKRKSVNLDRINDGGAVLVDHFSDQIGVVEKAWIDEKEKQGRAILRFSKSDDGERILKDVEDGIRRNVSVRYGVNKMVLESDDQEKGQTFRIMDWEPLEISMVSVPADPTVGVGRSEATNDPPLTITFINKREDATMAPDNTNPPQEPGGDAGSRYTQVDLDKAHSDAQRKEMERADTILTLGIQHGCETLARQYIKEGKTLDEFRTAVLTEVYKAKPVDTVDPRMGMSEREVKRYSFLKVIRALAERNPAIAPFEFECSTAYEAQIKKTPRGIWIPPDITLDGRLVGVRTAPSEMELLIRSMRALLMQRELTVGVPTAGGNIVATDLLSASFIELLRNAMMVRRMGATILGGLVGDVAIPSQTTGSTGGFVLESANVALSELALGQVPMTPKTVGAFSDISRKLLLQASMDVEALVRSDLAFAVALAIDNAALQGDGTGANPTGIANLAGIGVVSHGTDGGPETWPKVVEYETNIASANAALASLWYATTSKVFGHLKIVEKATGTAQFLGSGRITDTAEVNSYPAGITNQLPDNLAKGMGTNLSRMIFGNFKDLVIGEWSGLDLLVDNITLGLAGGLRLIVHQDVDVAARHVASFTVSNDIDTA